MNQTIAITPKWQIHIPVSFRKALDLLTPGVMEIKLVRKEIILKPKASRILKAAGKYSHLKPIKEININRIRDYIDYSSV